MAEWEQQPRCGCWAATAALELLNPAFWTEVIGPEPGVRAGFAGEVGGWGKISGWIA